MTYARRIKTFPFHHSSWADDSVWHFRDQKATDDDDAVVNMQTRVVIHDIDDDMLRVAKKGGQKELAKLIGQNVSQETVMSARKAFLAQMSDRFEGSEFVLPDDFVKGEEFGTPERDKSGAYIPHPLAGTIPPATTVWIGLQTDSDMIDDVYLALNDHYQGRDAEAEATFPDEPTPLAGRSRVGHTAGSGKTTR